MKPISFNWQAGESDDPAPQQDLSLPLRRRQTVAVAFSMKDSGQDVSEELSPTLRAIPHAGSHANGGGQVAVAAYGFQQRIARNGRGDMGDVVSALNAQSGETGKGDAAPCVAIAMQVRRLTPRECERLQGFPDDYTLVPTKVKRLAPPGSGPCAKQTVTATIVAENGTHFVATNHCLAPQSTCARAGMPTGVGYELCKSVCRQPVHAEINAVEFAGKHARGGTLYLEGHTYACDDCVAAVQAAGVTAVVLGKPPGNAADGPRYKAIGNSWAVPVVRWIANRIERELL